jgi:hypothetical protein
MGGVALALLAAANLSAQTNAPAGTNSLWQDVGKVGGDAWDALKAADWGQGIGASPFGLYVGGNWGGGLEVQGIETNTPVHLGFAIAAINEKQPNGKAAVNWYDGALTISLTGHQDVPLLGTVEVSAITGPAFNLTTWTAYSQSFMHFQKDWPLGKHFSLGLGGGPGYLSKYADKIAYQANLTLSFPW